MLHWLSSDAPPHAVLHLMAQLAMGVALLGGMWLARRKRFRAHGICQSAVMLLNLIPIGGYMLPVFRQGVLPGVPARLADSFYLWPTIHAVLGGGAELLGLYIILRAGTNLLPAALRFENYKRWMRTALALWWLTIGLGLCTYFTWYKAGAQTPTPAPTQRSAANVHNNATQPATAPPDVIIEMRNFAFEPKEVTIAEGTTVIWKDAAGRHSVKAEDGSFESEILPTSGEFRHKFERAGRYPVYCTLHGAAGGHDMAGVITVKART